MPLQPQRDTDTTPTGASPQSGAQRGGFLSVSNLVKRFGAHTALSDVSPVSYTHLTLPTILLV